MEFHLLPIFSFLTLLLVAAHAASSPENYWKCELPTTPMPKAIANLLKLGGSSVSARDMAKHDDPNNQLLIWGRETTNKAQSEDDPNNPLVFYGHGTTNDAQLQNDPNNQLLIWGRGTTNRAQSQDDPNNPLVLYGHGTTNSAQLQDDPNNQLLIWGRGITNRAQSQDDPNNQLLIWGRRNANRAQSQDDPNNQLLIWGRGTTNRAQSQDDPNNQLLIWGQGTTNRAQSQDDPNNQLLIWGQRNANRAQSQDDPNNQLLIWERGTTNRAQSQDDPNNQLLIWGQRNANRAQLQDDPNNQLLIWGQRTTSGAQSKDDPNNQIIFWRWGTTRTTHLHDNMNSASFFLEEDLRPNTKMDLRFTKSKYMGTLLPREVIESIPFSSGKIQEILDKLSVKPGSEKAKIIEKTIRDCEQPRLNGEEMHCATSLESMIDFITSKIGKNVQALSTEMEKETQPQKFTVKPGLKKLAEDKVIACHQRHYPYAVFLCHKLAKTRAYFVPLEGADGARVKAIAVCHTDTSEWDPNNLAFQVLKVKPGTVPVCHFSPDDNVVWLPK